MSKNKRDLTIKVAELLGWEWKTSISPDNKIINYFVPPQMDLMYESDDISWILWDKTNCIYIPARIDLNNRVHSFLPLYAYNNDDASILTFLMMNKKTEILYHWKESWVLTLRFRNGDVIARVDTKNQISFNEAICYLFIMWEEYKNENSKN